jgi:flagellar biosynthesis/type III secretory pathway M-ring protein FliF/YscJ
MEGATLYLVVLMFVAALIISAALFYYVYTTRRPGKKKTSGRKTATRPKQVSLKAQHPATQTKSAKPGALVLPPFAPRNRDTLKIIAEERPDVIVKIVRKWLREGSK